MRVIGIGDADANACVWRVRRNSGSACRGGNSPVWEGTTLAALKVGYLTAAIVKAWIYDHVRRLMSEFRVG